MTRAIFMGTPDFAVPAADVVRDACELVAVFTKAPAPVGRKQVITKSPIHQWAEEKGIPVITPKSLRKQPEYVEQIRELAPDIIVVFAYGLILPQSVLDIAECVCVHPSALPKYRGMNPIGRAIWSGDVFTEVDLIRMDAGVDTGPVMYREEINLEPEITRGELESVVAIYAASALSKYLASPRSYPPIPQTYDGEPAPAFSPEELEIDFGLPAHLALCRINALLPTPAGYFALNGEKIKIHAATLGHQTDDAPGTLTVGGKRIFIACADGGSVEILELQKPGGKIMPAKDFLNGIKK